YLSNIRFHRHVGEYAGHFFDLQGNLISKEEFEAKKSEWLPTIKDREYVGSLMKPVTEVGKIANWIAPPATGIKGKPFEFEYVRLAGLYHYCRSKEELLFLIQDHCFGRVMESLEQRIKGVEDPFAKLRIFIDNHLSFFAANMAEMKVLSHEGESLAGDLHKHVS